MEPDNLTSMEKALAGTDADAVVKTAIAAVGSLKKLRTDAQTGNLS